MTPRSLSRALAAAAGVVLLLGLTACGDEGSDDAGGGGTDGPEAAYAAFADAVRGDDQGAFDAAVHDGYWSDLNGVEGDNAANLAVHHWHLENGVLSLPDEAPEVLVGEEILGQDAEGDVDDYAAMVGKAVGEDDLTGDDLAMVRIEDGYLTRTANEAKEAGCVEADEPIDECVEEPGEAEPTDVAVYLVRGEDGWKAFGTEYD